jgi:hypothetical protein
VIERIEYGVKVSTIGFLVFLVAASFVPTLEAFLIGAGVAAVIVLLDILGPLLNRARLFFVFTRLKADPAFKKAINPKEI